MLHETITSASIFRLGEKRFSEEHASSVNAVTRIDAFLLGQRLLLVVKASRRSGCRKIREMGTPVKQTTMKCEAKQSLKRKASRRVEGR